MGGRNELGKTNTWLQRTRVRKQRKKRGETGVIVTLSVEPFRKHQTWAPFSGGKGTTKKQTVH